MSSSNYLQILFYAIIKLWVFTHQNHNMIMKHAVMRDSSFTDCLGFFNLNLPLSLDATLAGRNSRGTG